MKLFTLLFAMILSSGMMAQFESEQVNLLGHFDDDNLPTHTYGTFNDIWGYAADGREYAIMGSAAFIHVFDVTDPGNIVVVKTIDPQSQTVWRDFKTYGHYLYAVADSSPDGLIIIDLSGLPNDVTQVNQIKDQFNSSHNIYIDVDNARLYTAGSGNGTFVYDLSSDPVNPTYLGKANLGNHYMHDVYVRDNILYGSGGYDGYFIYDLTDVENEVLIASNETQGYNHSSWVSEDGTYVLFAEEVPTGLPMGIMDLCDIENGNIEVNNYFKFPLLAPNQEGATPHNPFLIGNYAYVSYYHDGLVLFDLSDPSDVKRVGYFDTYPSNTSYPSYQGAWGCYPFLPSGTVLIADMENGLFALDFLLDDLTPPDYNSLCSPITSNEEVFAAQDLDLYPNPTTGLVQYFLPETVNEYTLQVTNAAGQIMRQSEMTRQAKQEQMDLAGLNPGIYFVQIQSEGQLFQQKLILE